MKVIKGSSRPPKCFNNFVNEKLPNPWMSLNGLSNLPQTIIDLQPKTIECHDEKQRVNEIFNTLANWKYTPQL